MTTRIKRTRCYLFTYHFDFFVFLYQLNVLPPNFYLNMIQTAFNNRFVVDKSRRRLDLHQFTFIFHGLTPLF